MRWVQMSVFSGVAREILKRSNTIANEKHSLYGNPVEAVLSATFFLP